MNSQSDDVYLSNQLTHSTTNAGLPPPHLPNKFNLYENVAYDEYWHRASRQKLNALEHTIVNELLPATGECIIDLGCGYGRLADCYINRFRLSVMFDGSRTLLQAAQQITQGKALYVLGDLNYLPFKTATFDCALMVRTFHHLDDPTRCLKSLGRILRNGGSFILNYSNKRNIHRVLKYLFGNRYHNPFSREPDRTEPNFIHHHPDHVQELLKNTGFSISDARGAGIVNILADVAPAFLFPILPTGKFFAPLFGKFQLAPWIFLKATAHTIETPRTALTAEELFACPLCGSSLIQTTHSFSCTDCRKNYPIIDDIIDMRIVRET